MAKRVFFSFHYQDVVDFRANVVRNHWMTKPDREEAGYFDGSVWESARRQGEVALKRLINGALDGTSNTCVLIGSQTYARPWVRYELFKSFRRGNHLFGVHINEIKAKEGTVKSDGPNPLAFIGVAFSSDGQTATLMEWDGTQWTKYDQIDGTAEYSFQVEQQFRGKGFKFSDWYPAYNWIGNDGFNNFSSWVK